MSWLWILALITVYLAIGGSLLAYGEQKGWITIAHSLGYIVFPILWLPLMVVILPYIVVKYFMIKKGK